MHSTLPSRPLAPLAGRPAGAPRRVVARFQSAGGAEPASADATIVHFEVAQAVPYGQRVAVLGDAAELGAWQPEKAAILEWGAEDVWTGQAKITAASPSVEYKLLTVGDDGSPITWQAGPNRVLELSAAEVKVADSLEGEGGPTVEPLVVAAAAAAAAAAPAPAPPAAPAPSPAPKAAPPPSSAVVAAAAASAPAPAPTSTTSLDSLTVKELKARLTAAGLTTTGKKADLIARLQKGA